MISMDTIRPVILALASCVLYVWLIYKYGLEETFRMIVRAIEAVVNRVTKGPKPKPVENCQVLHLVAESEIGLFGFIRSTDLAEHMATCRRFGNKIDESDTKPLVSP